jgi:hypothetical protein
MSTAVYDSLFTLANGGVLSGKVFDTVRLNDTGALIRDQYVVLFHTTADPESERFNLPATMSNSALELEFDVRAVGTTARGAARTLEAFLTRTVGQTLTVPGRQVTPLTVGVSGSRVQTDRSVSPPLYYQDASVICVSRPA